MLQKYQAVYRYERLIYVQQPATVTFFVRHVLIFLPEKEKSRTQTMLQMYI